jgi:hypothetical protein
MSDPRARPRCRPQLRKGSKANCALSQVKTKQLEKTQPELPVRRTARNLNQSRLTVADHMDIDPWAPRRHNLERNLWRVVLLGHVPKVKRAKARPAQFCREICCLVIREMTDSACNTPLQVKRIRSNGKHLEAMVRFDKRRIGVAKHRNKWQRHVTQVRRNHEYESIGLDAQCHLRSIVWKRARAYFEWANANGHFSVVAIHGNATAKAHRENAIVKVERRVGGARKRLGMAYVVAVVVRDENGIGTARKELGAKRTHARDGSGWV